MPPEGTVRFVFGIHNHQPAGNFLEVFEKAYAWAYDPLLAALARHPEVRCVVHYSGCLLEWLEKRRPGHLEALRWLASRGQIEILTGGFYEPILPLIPPADREGQIRLLSRWIEERLGRRPTGMWLAERVWEPALAADLRRAGVAYALLDDYHFLGALDEDPVGGYYLTDESGDAVALFPISEALRYLIPFREPEETLRFLAERRGRDEVVVMVDDGEKFGLWPDTFEWVHEGGWLERFLAALEGAQREGWLLTTTLSEAASALRPRGRVYLPANSYFEMTEWALPPDKRRRFEGIVRGVMDRGQWREMRPFLRGGFFRSYLARYPESLRMVSRGRSISRRLDQLDEEAARSGRPSAARRHLWRAQCNCGYWHGLFGGLYLPHIRRSIHEELALSEAALWDAAPEPGGVRVGEGRPDGFTPPAIEITNDRMALTIEPESGGAVTVLDLTRRPLPLGATLTRRREAYHDEAREEARRAAASPAPRRETAGISIHERRPAAAPDLPEHLAADPRDRAGLTERFLPAAAGPAALMRGEVVDLDQADRRAQVEVERRGGGAAVRLARLVRLGAGAGRPAASLRLVKQIEVRPGREWIRAAFRSDPSGGAPAPAFPPGILFAVELNLALVESEASVGAGDGALRGAGEAWAAEGVDAARVEEGRRGFRLRYRAGPPAALWHHPVRTVSRSEAGFEVNYQGSAILFVWPLEALGRGGVWIEMEAEDLR